MTATTTVFNLNRLQQTTAILPKALLRRLNDGQQLSANDFKSEKEKEKEKVQVKLTKS